MNNPLVSIAVITYNSARTIIETLESVNNQTYQNIELIISDDCSTDGTIAICQNWLSYNSNRFVRVEFVSANKNTGVSANYNRAEAACQGEWVKCIAGDDILMPNCIQDCMDYVTEHQDTIYLFGRCQVFGGTKEMQEQVESQFRYDFFELPLDQQYRRLIYEGNCLPATTAFYHRERVKAIGVQNDERIPLLEDWPKWINLVKAGVKFRFIDKVLVKYRVSETSLSTSSVKSAVYIKSEALLYKYYRFPYFYRQGDKKDAVLKLLQAEKSIHNNAFIWRVIVFIYKKLTRTGKKTQQ